MVKKYLLILLTLSIFITQNLIGEKNKSLDLIIPVILNATLGFGIGSYIQGDIAGGSLFLSLHLLNYIAPIVLLSKWVMGAPYGIDVLENTIIIVGGIAFALRVFEIIKAVKYYQKHLTLKSSKIKPYMSFVNGKNQEHMIKAGLNILYQ